MPLHLHRAPRTDDLADRLGEMLSSPLADPFAEEVVVVPEHGIERWLAQRLSHRLGATDRGDGVCAGVRFLRPASLVTMLTDRERDDPWLPVNLVWHLLEVVDTSLDEPWCRALAEHLGHGPKGDPDGVRAGRRWSVARRLAAHFWSYGLSRPDMLTAWCAGDDTDGLGTPLPDDLRWQPELWRRLVAHVDAPPPDQRHLDTMERLRDGDSTLALPGRLSLFGHTRIPATEVALLSALAEHRDVHLWLPHPSPALWQALEGVSATGPVPRHADTSAELVRHPLLASLGRDTRELQRTLATLTGAPGGAGALTDEVDTTRGGAGASPGTDAPPSALTWFQHDLRTDHPPTEAELAARVVAPDDRSLQVHACHGPTRQVEVLREVLVGLMADDPTLEPRDILVMCPDVETYAPLIGASFGLGDLGASSHGVDTHPAHRLRVRLADRALSSTNPLLAAAEQLVTLAGGRVTASEVLDLAANPAVARRFGFDADAQGAITDWVSQAAIRWGIDAAHRAPFGLDRWEQNTWRAGLDRLLLGVTVSGDGPVDVGGVMPVDNVGSSSIDLAGSLAELLGRVGDALDSLESATDAPDWMRRLVDAVRALTDVPPRDAWQVTVLESTLVGAVAQCPAGVQLRLADVRALLERTLGGRATRSSFRTGTLTVCTMVPMRSIPHRVVCLLGLDDGTFPRNPTPDGDDVLARTPRTGERDARSEDRQLLLDAVLAATETLVVTYTGADPHTGARRPPAVPLGELVDAARATATPPTDAWPVTTHPLQSFDEANLVPGALTATPHPFTFDRAALDGALAARGELRTAGPQLASPLPEIPSEDVAVADLVAFLHNPARAYLQGRLGAGVPRKADEVADHMPVGLEGLERWGVGDRLLRGLLRQQDDGTLDPEVLFDAELLGGELPPGALGDRELEAMRPLLQQLVSVAMPLRRPVGRTVDVAIDLGAGRLLHGPVDAVHGDRVVHVSWSRFGPKPLIRAWVHLVALTANDPQTSWTASVVAQDAGKVSATTLGPLSRDGARAYLRELVDLYDRGRREPLPLPLQTGHTYAKRYYSSDGPASLRASKALESAAKAWTGSDYVTGEASDLWWGAALGREVTAERLHDGSVSPTGAGLGTLANTLWRPVLDNTGSAT